MKKSGLFLALVFGLSIVSVSVFAKDVLDSKNVAAGAITSETKAGAFTILATSAKGVNVEAIKAVKASDGKEFTSKIKLNGAGDATTRAVSFKIAKSAKVTVYLQSSSKTEDRTLLVADKNGDIIDEINAPKDDETNAGVGSVVLKKAGEYFLYSKKAGINIYMVVVE